MSIRVTKQSVMVFAEIPSDLQVAMQSIIVLGQSDLDDLRVARQSILVLGQIDPDELRTAQQFISVIGEAPGPIRMSGLHMEVLHSVGLVNNMIPTSELGISLTQSINVAFGRRYLDTSNDLALTDIAHQPDISALAENTLSISTLIEHNWYSVSAVTNLLLSQSLNTSRPWYVTAEDTITPADAARPGLIVTTVENTLTVSQAAYQNLRVISGISTLALIDVIDYSGPRYASAVSALSMLQDIVYEGPISLSAESTLVLTAGTNQGVVNLSATNQFSLSDSTDTSVPNRAAASNDLTLTQEVFHPWVFANASNDISFWAYVNYVGPKSASAVTEIDIVNTWSQVVYIPETFEVAAESLLEMGFDVVLSGTQSPSAENTLTLGSTADTLVKHREVTTSISLSQSADFELIKRLFSTLSLGQSAIQGVSFVYAENTISLSHSARPFPYIIGPPGLHPRPDYILYGNTLELTQAVWSSIKSLSVENTLTLSQSENTTQPIRVTATTDMTGPLVIVYDEELLEYVEVPEYEMTQTVSHTLASGTRSEAHWLQTTQAVTVTLIQTTGVAVSATSTLVLTDDAIFGHAEEAVTQLYLSHSAHADISYFATSDLGITDEATRIILRSTLAVENTLQLISTLGYSFDLSKHDLLHVYTPFVGTTTDPDAPPPPKWQQPALGHHSNGITFFYPFDTPTQSVTLRGPEFDNTDRLSFHRINRESRGGTLIVYADRIWPKIQHLSFQFNALTEDEAQDFINFCQQTLGKEIGLTDWENRDWRGVIVSPQDPIVRDHRNGLTASVEMEAEIDASYALTAYNTLSTMFDTATLNVALGRSGTSNLFTTMTQTASADIDLVRFMFNTFSLTDGVGYLAIRDRSVVNNLFITDVVLQGAGLPRSAANDIIAAMQVDVLVYSTRPADTFTFLTQEVEGLMVRPRSGVDTLLLDDSLEISYSLQRDTDSTLILTHVAKQDTVWPRDADSTFTITDLLHTVFVLSKSLENTFTPDHWATQDSIFVRPADNTLISDDEVDRIANFVRSAEDTTFLSDEAERALVFDHSLLNDVWLTSIVDRNIVLNRTMTDLLGLNQQLDYVAIFPRSIEHDLTLTHSLFATYTLRKDLVNTLTITQELVYTADFNRTAITTLTPTDESLYLAIFVRPLENTLVLSTEASQITAFDRYADNTLLVIGECDRLTVLGKHLEHTCSLISTVEQDTVWPRSAENTLVLGYAIERWIVVQKDVFNTLVLSDGAEQDTVWPRSASNIVSLTDTGDRLIAVGKDATTTLIVNAIAEQDTVWPRGATSGLVIDHIPDVLIAVTKNQVDDLILTNSATRLMVWDRYADDALTLLVMAEQDIARPRSADNTLILSDESDRIITVSKGLFNTLTLNVTATQDTVWLRTLDHTLTLDHILDRIISIQKNVFNTLVLTAEALQDTVWPRSANNTLVMADISDRTVILGKDTSTIITLSDGAEQDTVWPRGATSGLAIDHIPDVLISVTKDQVDDLILTDSATRSMVWDRYAENTLTLSIVAEQDTVWPRSTSNAFILTDNVDRIITISKNLSHSLILVHSATQDAMWPRPVVNNFTLEHEADRTVVLSKALVSTLVMSHAVVRSMIFDRYAENTLTPTDMADETSILNRSAENTSTLTDSGEQDTVFATLHTYNDLASTDVADRIVILQKQPNNTLVLLDGASQNTVWSRNSENTLILSDVGNRTATLGKQLSNTLVLSDATSQNIARLLDASSSLALNAVLDRNIVLGKGPSNTLVLNDLPDQDMVWPRDSETLLDLASVGDRIATLGKQLSNSFTVTQDSIFLGSYVESAESTLTLSDVSEQDTVFATLQPYNDLASTDVADRTVVLQKQPNNTLTLSDTTSQTMAWLRSSENTVILSDVGDRTAILGKQLSNDVTVTDSSGANISRLLDAVSTLIPDHTLDRNVILGKGPSNTLALDDTPDQDTVWPRDSSDTLLELASVSGRIATLGKQLVDSFTITQDIAFLSTYGRSADTTMTLSDSSLYLAVFDRSPSNTLISTDSANRVATYDRSEEHTIGITDLLDHSFSVSKAAVHSLVLTDAASRLLVFDRYAENTLSLDVVGKRIGTIQLEAITTLIPSQTAEQDTVWPRSAATTLVLTAAAIYLAISNRSAENTLVVSDVAEQDTIWPRSADSTFILTDTVDRIASASFLGTSILVPDDIATQVITRLLHADNTEILDHSADVIYSLQRHPDNILSVTEEVILATDRSRNASNTFLLDSLLAYNGVYDRASENNLSLTEEVIGPIVLFRNAEDTFSLSHDALYLAVFDRPITDTLSITHSPNYTATLSRVADSTTSLTDVGDRIATLGKTLITTIIAGQDTDNPMVRPRDAEDIIGLTQDIEVGFILQRGSTNTLLLTQNLVYPLTRSRTATTTMTLSDVAGRIITVQKDLTSSLNVTQVLTDTWSYLRNAENTLILTDASSNIISMGRAAENTLGITDSAASYAAVFVRSFENTLTISDIAAQETLRVLNLDNTLSLTDVGDHTAILNKGFTTTIVITDLAEQDLELPRFLTQNLVLTHLLEHTAILGRSVTDTLTITDVATEESILGRAAENTTIISTEATVLSTLGRYAENLCEPVHFASQNAIRPRSLETSLDTLHQLIRIVSLGKWIQDGLIITDVAEQDTVFPRAAESIAIIDHQIDANYTLGREMIDALTLSQIFVGVMVRPREATDTLLVSDAIETTFILNKFSTDTLTASDGVSVTSTLNRAGIDALTLISTVGRNIVVSKAMADTLSFTASAEQDTFWALRGVEHTLSLSQGTVVFPIRIKTAASYIFLNQSVGVIPISGGTAENDISLTGVAMVDSTVKLHYGINDLSLTDASTVLRIVERSVGNTLIPSDIGDRTAILSQSLSHTLTLSSSMYRTHERSIDAYLIMSQSASVEKVDVVRGEVYIVNKTKEECISMDTDGNSVGQVFSYPIGTGDYAVIDGINERIYWTEYAAGKIMRADLDGTNITAVVTGLPYSFGPYTRLGGIAVDALQDRIYYTVISETPAVHKVYRNNLNGTNQEDITPFGFSALTLPEDIAVDSSTDTLYFADWQGDDIYKSTTSGTGFGLFANAVRPVQMQFVSEHGYVVWQDGAVGSPQNLRYAHRDDGTPVLIKELDAGDVVFDIAYNSNDDSVYFVYQNMGASPTGTQVRKIRLDGTGDTVIYAPSPALSGLRGIAISTVPVTMRERSAENTLTLTQQIDLTAIQQEAASSTVSMADGVDYNFATAVGPESTLILNQFVQLVTNLYADSTLLLTDIVLEGTTTPRSASSTLILSSEADRLAVVSHDAVSTVWLTTSASTLLASIEFASSTIMFGYYADSAPTYDRYAENTLSLDDEIIQVHVALAESTLFLTHDLIVGYQLARFAVNALITSDTVSYLVDHILLASNTLSLTDTVSRAGSSVAYYAENTLSLVSAAYQATDLSASNSLSLSDYSHYDIHVGIGPLWLGMDNDGDNDGLWGMNLFGQLKHIFGVGRHPDIRIDTAGDRVYGMGYLDDGPKWINSWNMDGTDAQGIVDLDDGSWPWAGTLASIETFEIDPANDRLYFVTTEGENGAVMYSVRMSDGGDHIEMYNGPDDGGFYPFFGHCLRRDPDTNTFYTIGKQSLGGGPSRTLLKGNGYGGWTNMAYVGNELIDAIALDNNHDYVYFGSGLDPRVWRVNKVAPYNLLLVTTLPNLVGYGSENMVYDHDTDILYIASQQAVLAVDLNDFPATVRTLLNTSVVFGDGTQRHFESIELNDTVGSYTIKPRAAWNDLALVQSTDAIYSYSALNNLVLIGTVDLNSILNQDLESTLLLTEVAIRTVAWAIRTAENTLLLTDATVARHDPIRTAENTLTLDDQVVRTFDMYPENTTFLTQDLDRTAFTSQTIVSALTLSDGALQDLVGPRATSSTLVLSQAAQETTVFNRSEAQMLILTDIAQRTSTVFASNTIFLTQDIVDDLSSNFALYLMDDANNRCRTMTVDGEFIQDIFSSGTPYTPGDAVISITDDKIFWVETHGTAGAVKSANLDGSNVTTVASFPNAQAIAVDDTNNQIFVYVHGADSATRAIWRINYNGSNPQKIISGLTDVFGLEIYSNKLYIVDNGAGLIKRSDLTGSNLEDIVATGTSGPAAITIDRVHDKLFWSDVAHQDIKYADLNGSNITQVAFIATYATDMVYNPEDEYVYYTIPNQPSQVWRIKAYASFPVQDLLRIDHDSVYTGIALGRQDWIESLTATNNVSLTQSASVALIKPSAGINTVSLSDDLILVAVLNRSLENTFALIDLTRDYLGMHEDGISTLSLSHQVELLLTRALTADSALTLDATTTHIPTWALTVEQTLSDLDHYVLYDLNEHVEGDGRVYTGEGYEGGSVDSRIVKFRTDLTAKETAIELGDLPYPTATSPKPSDTYDLEIVDDRIYFGSQLYAQEFSCDLNGANFLVYPNPPVYRTGRSFIDTQNNNMYSIHAPLITWYKGYGSKWDLDNVSPTVDFGSDWASDVEGSVSKRKLWYADRSPSGRIVEINLDTNVETIQVAGLTDHPGESPDSLIHLNYDSVNERLFWLYNSNTTGFTRAFYADIEGPNAWVVTEIPIPTGYFEHIAYNSRNDSIYMVCYQDNVAADTYIGLHSVKVTAPYTHNQVSCGTEYQKPWGLAIAASSGYVRVRQLLSALDPKHQLAYSYVTSRSGEDTLSLTDAVIQGMAFLRTLTQTLILTDAASAIFVPRLDATDILTVTDGASQNRIRTDTLISTLSLSDTASAIVVSIQAASNTSILTDTATGAVTVRQRWAESDLLLTDVGSELSILGQATANTCVLTGTAVRNVSRNLLASSILAMTEAASAVVDRSRTAENTLLVSYTLDRNIAVALASVNTVWLTDVADRNIVSQVASDSTLILTDTGYEDTNFIEMPTNSLLITDTLGVGFILNRLPDTTLILTGIANETTVLPRFGEDSLSLAQALNLGYTLYKASTSTIVLSDTASETTIFDRAMIDTLLLSDVSVGQPVFNRSVIHTLTITDALNLSSILSKPAESTLTLTDAAGHEHFINQALTSTLALTHEAPVIIVYNAATTVWLTDASNFLGVWDRYADSTFVATTSTDTTVVYSRDMSNSFTLTDTVLETTVWSRSIAHSLLLADNLDTGYSLQRAETSTLSLTDSVSFSLIRDVSADNTVSLTDGIDEVTIALQALESTAILGQALSLAGSIYNRRPEDTITWQNRAWNSIVEEAINDVVMGDLSVVSIIYAGDDFTTYPRLTFNDLQLTHWATFSHATVESADTTTTPTHVATRTMVFARSASSSMAWLNRAWPQTKAADAENTLVSSITATAVIEPLDSDGGLYLVDKE